MRHEGEVGSNLGEDNEERDKKWDMLMYIHWYIV